MKLNRIRIKDIREDNDNTQQEIADILEVKRGTYASWECGNDIIPLKKLIIYANYYNKSIDYILGINNEDVKINSNYLITQEQISKNLKNIRCQLNLTQKEIAESIDINQSTWWGYENGKTLITTSTLYSLAKFYNYSIDSICGRIK